MASQTTGWNVVIPAATAIAASTPGPRIHHRDSSTAIETAAAAISAHFADVPTGSATNHGSGGAPPSIASINPKISRFSYQSAGIASSANPDPTRDDRAHSASNPPYASGNAMSVTCTLRSADDTCGSESHATSSNVRANSSAITGVTHPSGSSDTAGPWIASTTASTNVATANPRRAVIRASSSAPPRPRPGRTLAGRAHPRRQRCRPAPRCTSGPATRRSPG